MFSCRAVGEKISNFLGIKTRSQKDEEQFNKDARTANFVLENRTSSQAIDTVNNYKKALEEARDDGDDAKVKSLTNALDILETGIAKNLQQQMSDDIAARKEALLAMEAPTMDLSLTGNERDERRAEIAAFEKARKQMLDNLGMGEEQMAKRYGSVEDMQQFLQMFQTTANTKQEEIMRMSARNAEEVATAAAKSAEEQTRAAAERDEKVVAAIEEQTGVAKQQVAETKNLKPPKASTLGRSSSAQRLGQRNRKHT